MLEVKRLRTADCVVGGFRFGQNMLKALVGGRGFDGNAPGGPSPWSTERSTAWEPVRPELVVEVRYDHVTGGRFRHETKLLRFRPSKGAQAMRFRSTAARGKSGQAQCAAGQNTQHEPCIRRSGKRVLSRRDSRNSRRFCQNRTTGLCCFR